MNIQESAQAEVAREVRRGWIIFYGVLELLIGALLGLMSVGLMVLALFSESFRTPMGARGGLVLVFPVLLYGAGAMLFLFTGAGTLGRRRWARIVMLVVSWLWLACGIVGGAMVLIMLPFILEQAAKTGQAVSGHVKSLVWAIIGGSILVFSVVLPGSFLIFYTRKSVKAAFEKREGEEAGREKLPVLVAILAVWIGLCALASLSSLPYGLLVWFGFFITGAPAIVLGLVNAGFQGFLGWRIVRREPWIWWMVLVYYLLLGLSATITFFRVPMSEIVTAMGLGQDENPAQRQAMRVMQSYLPWFGLISQVLFLGLILLVKRHFGPRAELAEPPAVPGGNPGDSGVHP